MLALFGNINLINRIVMNGELDTYLLQPRNPLLNLLMFPGRISRPTATSCTDLC